MEDTLSIDIFVKFDFPVPEFGVYDTGAPERIIGIIAEDYVGFTSLGIADMELIHIDFPFYWRMKEGSAVFVAGRIFLLDSFSRRIDHFLRPSLYLNYSIGETICQALFSKFYKIFSGIVYSGVHE